jgi:hypothetical protein
MLSKLNIFKYNVNGKDHHILSKSMQKYQTSTSKEELFDHIHL